MKTLAHLVEGREVYYVDKEATVQEAAKHMAEKNIGAVSVIDGDRLVGIFSERDLLSRVVAKGKDPAKTKVKEVMTTDLVVAEKDESYEAALKKMKRANVRHLPVVSGERIIGMLSVRDLLQVDLSEKDEEINLMKAYIYHVPPDLSARV